jgi:addiction module HigA family antidote
MFSLRNKIQRITTKEINIRTYHRKSTTQCAGISPELAIKHSEVFGNTAQFWINLQKNYELWRAER